MTDQRSAHPIRAHKGHHRQLRRPAWLLARDAEQEVSVGRRLREVRALRGLSMRALSELSGLNVNTLSLIENEHTSPSVSTLQQLAQSLHIPIGAFFQTAQQDQLIAHQQEGQRLSIAFEHGLLHDLASGMRRPGAEPLLLHLNSHADSGPTPIVHTGREFVYCLDGEVVYTVDSHDYALRPGDSLVFEAYLPHYWKNPRSTRARVLLVLCPTDTRDSPKERHFAA
jgi:transcriptional regulator with XRE-family HTH domain